MVDELLVTIAPFFLITAAAVVVGELNFVFKVGSWVPPRGFLAHDRDGLDVDVDVDDI